MKVYLVCEVIDLGYHVVAGYLSEDRAKEVMTELVNKAVQDKIESLMLAGYNRENAEKYARTYYGYYELEQVEVEE